MTELTPQQQAREASVLFAIVLDTLIGVALLAVAILGGSLTIMAETIRGFLGETVEIFSLWVMRRIHRGKVTEFEFGPGKLEQVCNLAIAVSMLVGAAWVAQQALRVLIFGHTASPVGLTLAACFGALNTFLNFVAWDEVRRAARGQPSVVMRAQLTSRLTKLVSSCIVQVTMTLAALASDPVLAGWADGGGALFVACYMVFMARDMLRHGLPDLLDQSVDEATQLAVLRVLAAHFDAYDQLLRLRSRRSGSTVFIEMTFGCGDDLSLAELERRSAAISAGVAREVAGADIAILFSPYPDAVPAGRGIGAVGSPPGSAATA